MCVSRWLSCRPWLLAHPHSARPPASQTSNATLPTVFNNQTFWNRGRPNLAADFDYLNTLGLGAAMDVVYTGGSAGGSSVFFS